MEILSEAEVQGFKLNIRQSKNPIVSELEKLKIGQGLKVLRDEWNYKTPIDAYIGGVFRKNSSIKFSSRRLIDGSGWLVVRIK